MKAVKRFYEFAVASTGPLNMAAWAVLIYILANSGGFMYFNYYIYLAESMLQGKLYIENPASWLTEFTWHDGKPYLFYGPLPAVILVPLVAVFQLFHPPAHEFLNLSYVSIAVGALDVALVWILLERLGATRKTVFWLTAIFGFGSVHFWVSEYGNNWLFSQVVAEAFMLLGAVEALGKRRGWLVGILLGAAILSRNSCLLAVPFYLAALNLPRAELRRSAWYLAGLAFMAGLNGWYNWARFGNPLDNGYVAGEAALLRPAHGSFSLHYLVKMLPAYVWRGPTFQWAPPFVTVSDHGLSVFWTTPPFLYLLPAAVAFFKKRPAAFKLGLPGWSATDWWLAAAAWSALLPIAFLYLCYNGDGWRQFGSRYSLDYTPFILVILGLYFKDKLPRAVIWLAGAAFVINIWGVVWWRVFKW